MRIDSVNFDHVEVADCRAWLAELPENSIDLFMTSPPYWSPQSPRSTASTLECIWDESARCQHEWSSEGSCPSCGAWKGELGLEPTAGMYVTHLLDIFMLVKKALKPTGSFYLNLWDAGASTRRRHSEDKGISDRLGQRMLNDGWVLVDKSSWRKPNLTSPGDGRKSKYSSELLFHFVKNTKILLWRNAETRVWVEKKPLQRYRNLKTDVGTEWDKLGTSRPPIMKASTEDLTYHMLEERRLWREVWQPFAYYYDLDVVNGLMRDRIRSHVRAAPKTAIEGPQFEAFPEEFCIRPILSSCPPQGIVADPFVGSGTTLLVAKKLGRHYLGCDLNSDYIKMAKKRLASVDSPVT